MYLIFIHTINSSSETVVYNCTSKTKKIGDTGLLSIFGFLIKLFELILMV